MISYHVQEQAKLNGDTVMPSTFRKRIPLIGIVQMRRQKEAQRD